MTHSFKFQVPLLMAALLALPLAQAAAMSKADYKAGKTRISAEYLTDKTACGSLAGNAKDVCVEQAKAKDRVARAELEYGYTATSADRNKVRVAMAESAYAVAKERCDDHAGNTKDLCLKEAKAVEVKALADAKLSLKVGEAAQDSADVKRDADFEVAAQKCETLAGDAKASCLATAKSQFGKN